MRPDLAPVLYRNGAALIAALDPLPDAEAALVRFRLADVDGLEVCRRVRRAAGTRRLRILMLLDEAEASHRDACFRAGCDDCVFAPEDLPLLAEKLAGVDETAFRKETRYPATFSIDIDLPGGERSVEGESLSKTAARVRWSGEPPAKSIVRCRIRFPGAAPLETWARLEDVATRRGETLGIVLRFVGMLPREREDLYGFYVEVRAQTREVPSGLESGATSAARYERPPEPIAAPDEKVEALAEAPRGTRVLRSALLATLALAIVIGIASDVRYFAALRHPERALDPHPAEVIGELHLRRVGAIGRRYIAMADASWATLSSAERDRDARVLAERAHRLAIPRLEIYDGQGQVAFATISTGGAVALTIRR